MMGSFCMIPQSLLGAFKGYSILGKEVAVLLAVHSEGQNNRIVPLSPVHILGNFLNKGG